MLGRVPALEKKWPQIVVECGARIRVATMAKVPSSSVHWMLQVGETFSVAVPVLLPNDLLLDERAPADLLEVAFPPDGCRPTPDFGWPEFAERIADLGGVSVRRTNDYSDNRISADFFGPDEIATRMTELATTDDELTRARVR